MNFFKENILTAIKSGALVVEGDVFLDGQLIYDHIEETKPTKADEPTELGFVGHPDAFACRRNIYVDQIISDFKNSDDKFEREAAHIAPREFMFWDKQTDSLINDTDLEKVYRRNIKTYENVRAINPLIGLDAQPIKDSYFLPLALVLFPEHRHKVPTQAAIKTIQSYITNWIRDKALRLEYGDLKDRVGE